MAPPLFIGLLVLFNLTFSVEATESLKPSDQASDHFSFKDKPWVDLKPSQEYFDIPSPTEEKTAPTVYSLRSRIDAYHAIQKTDKELLLYHFHKLFINSNPISCPNRSYTSGLSA